MAGLQANGMPGSMAVEVQTLWLLQWHKIRRRTAEMGWRAQNKWLSLFLVTFSAFHFCFAARMMAGMTGEFQTASLLALWRRKWRASWLSAESVATSAMSPRAPGWRGECEGCQREPCKSFRGYAKINGFKRVMKSLGYSVWKWLDSHHIVSFASWPTQGPFCTALFLLDSWWKKVWGWGRKGLDSPLLGCWDISFWQWVGEPKWVYVLAKGWRAQIGHQTWGWTAPRTIENLSWKTFLGKPQINKQTGKQLTWAHMRSHENPWEPMSNHEEPWATMRSHEHTWATMRSNKKWSNHVARLKQSS